jgi:hypothetical protein
LNFRHLLVAALAMTVVLPGVRGAGAAPPPARQQSRADHILYTAPERWKHAENDRYTALRPPGVPAGKAVNPSKGDTQAKGDK